MICSLVMKKSVSGKIKKLIYPSAFILIIIMSVIYKLVFKGQSNFDLLTFKGGRTQSVISGVTESATSDAEGSLESKAATELPVTSKVTIVSVYICGEVNDPGIYKAPKGVLLSDIIEEAGGFTKDASVNNINLVYQISCNMSIYIPSEAEITKGFGGGDIIRQDGVYVWGNMSGSGNTEGGDNVQQVNINKATVEELKALPGIGEVTAKAIVDYRKNEPFKTIDDIKNVTGIGESKFKRIKDYICV